MAWIDSGRCTLAAFKQLPPEARIVVCTTLGVPASPPAPAAMAGRVLKHINDKKAAAGNEAPDGDGLPGGGDEIKITG